MALNPYTRFYIEPIPGSPEWKLLQTRSPVPIAHIGTWKTARWICERLNRGRDLSVAVGNLVNDHIEDLEKGDVATLIKEVRHALELYELNEP